MDKEQQGLSFGPQAVFLINKKPFRCQLIKINIKAARYYSKLRTFYTYLFHLIPSYLSIASFIRIGNTSLVHLYFMVSVFIVKLIKKDKIRERF